MTTVLSQTQMMLKQALKKRDELQTEIITLTSRLKRHEDHAEYMAEQLTYEKEAVHQFREKLYNTIKGR